MLRFTTTRTGKSALAAGPIRFLSGEGELREALRAALVRGRNRSEP